VKPEAGLHTNPIVTLFMQRFAMQFQFLLLSSTNFFNSVYFLTSTYFSADIRLQICYIYEGFFLLSVVFYILHVIRSCIVRFLIGSKFPPSSFLFLPNSVSSSIGLFTTVKMFPTSLSYMCT